MDEGCQEKQHALTVIAKLSLLKMSITSVINSICIHLDSITGKTIIGICRLNTKFVQRIFITSKNSSLCHRQELNSHRSYSAYEVTCNLHYKIC